MATTEIASGYPLLDDAEGYGRLNLFAAADGYGAFDQDVTVTMDAAKGGFNAIDTWRNDIGGKGKLAKRGSGILGLSGANSYAGGTVLEEGVLVAGSPSAFGTGGLSVNGGSLVLAADKPLTVGGDYQQLANAAAKPTLGADGAGTLVIAGKAALSGDLDVTLALGLRPGARNEDRDPEGGSHHRHLRQVHHLRPQGDPFLWPDIRHLDDRRIISN